MPCGQARLDLADGSSSTISRAGHIGWRPQLTLPPLLGPNRQLRAHTVCCTCGCFSSDYTRRKTPKSQPTRQSLGVDTPHWGVCAAAGDLRLKTDAANASNVMCQETQATFCVLEERTRVVLSPRHFQAQADTPDSTSPAWKSPCFTAWTQSPGKPMTHHRAHKQGLPVACNVARHCDDKSTDAKTRQRARVGMRV